MGLENTVNMLRLSKDHKMYEISRILEDGVGHISLSKMVNSEDQNPIKGTRYGIYCSQKKTMRKVS